ncbi:MAG: efflux RND transporter periplasmic adaptor subunit [Deltaproteobacteria bacterium]|nr:efflux RND transporter periplasmic adaptor subunit [Deltaproteobacteria bacterium]
MARRKQLSLMMLTLALLAGGLASWIAWQGRGATPSILGPAHAQRSSSRQLYTCGMHPQVVQEGPGTCPICGMDLTPIKKQPSGDHVPSAGQIAVDPVMVQNMGMRVATVKRGSVGRKVRTIGEVVIAEDLLSVVNLKFSGWVEKLYVDQTGIKVRKGQPLFRIYSPELVAALEEYLVALRTTGKDSPLTRAARVKFGYWDLSDAYIESLAASKQVKRTLTITAPRGGYVLHKNIVQGTRVNAGQDLFRIGKLSAIWVHAQVYEFDAPWVRVGQPATMELSYQRGRLYTGKVSYIYPTIDRKTRTLTVRLEFVNPNLQLKPGMFTTVRIETQRRENVLTVPTEAILYSGERLLVFVTKGLGKYQPREIVTGLASDDHTTEVISGLQEGEQVVTSGQFLLDSESQLQEALQKLMSARLQRNVASTASSQPTRTGADHIAGEVWSCPMHPAIRGARSGSCPICGMELVKQETVPGARRKPNARGR